MYHKKKAHFHFVGIGGIGMSGIATILHHQGHTVSGCDLDASQTSIAHLRSLGCAISEGNNTRACHTTYDALVYSSAINIKNNPEILAAQQKGIPLISRALMLAELMRTKHSIAVAGSHGKTTTSSLLAHILLEAHYDPTIIIGGYLSTISSNAHLGTSNFLIAEADESDRSLIQLPITSALITNIDFEHLETYRNLEDVQATFKQFLANIPPQGKAFVCSDDESLPLIASNNANTLTFGIGHTADFNATSLALNANDSSFDVWRKSSNSCLGTINLPIPGKHNVLNALGALTVAYDLGIEFSSIQKALATFKGVDRRFSYRGIFRGAEVFDDYGHHPTEIYHTLLVARRRAQKRLIVLFQPHRYSRTQGLWKEFIETFTQSSLDHLIITDIYSAHEHPIANISSAHLANELRAQQPSLYPVTYVPYDAHFNAIVTHLSSTLNSGDLLLILGAGKINNITAKITLKMP